jgi:hypothetical protein
MDQGNRVAASKSRRHGRLGPNMPYGFIMIADSILPVRPSRRNE